jgi:hypothetical protein
MRRGRLSGGFAAFGVAAVLAAPAGAATGNASRGSADPIQQGYGSPVTTVVLVTPPPPIKGVAVTRSSTKPSSSTAPLARTARAGTLPFTGSQLALYVLIGGMLLVSGLMFRATARGPSN